MRSTLVRILAGLGAAAALVFASGAAQAAEPPALGDGYVHDGSDVLSPAEEEAANARLGQLADDGDLELWIVYVDAFENPSGSFDWAAATADANGLGSDQYLLAIATDARQLALVGPVAERGEARIRRAGRRRRAERRRLGGRAGGRR